MVRHEVVKIPSSSHEFLSKFVERQFWDAIWESIGIQDSICKVLLDRP